MAFMLIEPPIVSWPGGWIGSEMFTLPQLSDLLQRSRDQVLEIGGLILTEQVYTVTPGVNRVELTDNMMRVDRATIQETNQTHRRILWHNDQQQLQTAVQETYQPAIGLPRQYATVYTPQLAIDLWPKPQNGGTLRMLVAQSGPNFNPTSVATTVGVMDDAAHILKYRALADALSTDGLSRAYAMARYCEGRWLRDMEMLDKYQSLLWCEVNGKRVTMTTLAQLDLWLPDWERSVGEPRYMAQPSWNLLQTAPKPDQPYTIVFEMVRKAPVPLADADFIQLDRSRMQSLYDYAQHIASFKMQGTEFEQTIPLLESFYNAAADYRQQQAAQSPAWADWKIKPRLERLWRPWRDEERIFIDGASREEAA
ncbi:MAG: hypothetical protein L0Y56_02715 [Nitrospira sp.]|nr:hypothetical protein [Nitrospira sp.]